MGKKISIKNIRLIITILHSLLTIAWQSKVFKNVGLNPSGTTPLNQVITHKSEIGLAYILTEAFALLFVFLFWKLFFHIIENFKKSYVVFISLFFIGLIFLALCWPYVFAYSIDNLVTYSCAVRLTPDYWHCAYSSYIYGACMLFFPVDFMILGIQWLFFLFMIAYTYYRAEKVAPKLKYLVIAIFLLPSFLVIMRDSYRIFQYLIIALIYAAIVLFDIIEGRQRTFKETILIAALGAFLAVWRSEGIIWATAWYVIYILCISAKEIRAKICKLLIFAVLFLLISIPQEIGMKTYYGKDYQIVNTLTKLRTLLNTPEVNLQYEGAEKDMEAIDTVMPHQLIAEYGLAAYLRYNSQVKGYSDINQSGVPADITKDFLKAYYSIALHNPKIYFRALVNTITISLAGECAFPDPYYAGEPSDIPPYKYDAWDIGRNDLYSNYHTYIWDEIASKTKVGEAAIEFHNKYDQLLTGSRRLLYAFIALCIIELWLFISGIIKFVKRKDLASLSFGLFGIVLLAEYAALTIVVPAYASSYYLTTNYLSLILAYAALIKRFKPKTEKTA